MRELAADVRGAIVDVLGHEAAQRGVNHDGTSNRLGRELDDLQGHLARQDSTHLSR